TEDARRTLDIASVIGREFDVETLEAVCGAPRGELIGSLDEAASLELLSEVRGAHGRYSFRHALIRQALYDGLSRGSRRDLHHAVAEAIRSLNTMLEPSAVIAYHYCQATSPDDADLTIDYSRKAAHEAQAQLAFEEAGSHLKNAIDALQLKRGRDEALRAELLCELGEAQVKAGDFAAARKTCLHAAEIARSTAHSMCFARAVVTAGRGVSNSGVTDQELVGLLNEALERLGQEDSPLRAQALSRLGVELYWSERERAVALCQQAVEMARRVNDPHTTIVSLWGRHLALRNPDSLEQRLADGREVIELAERAGERDFALEARYFRIADLVEAGDIDALDSGLREYLAAEAQLRDRFKRGLLLQSMRALMDGRLQEAATLAQQAFMAGQQSGRPLALNAFLIQHGNTMRELGRIGELEKPLRAFVTQNPLIVFARCALQLALIETGQVEEARVEFLKMAEDGFRIVPHDWNWLPSMFVLSEICAAIGETTHAETLYRLLAPYASRNAVLGYVYTYGSVAYALGKLAALLERFDEAESHFEAALAGNRKMRTALWAAHTEFELGGMLLARGKDADQERAQALIESARRASQSLGLVRLANKLSALSPGGSGDQTEEALSPAAPASGAGALEALAESAIAQARDMTALASLVGTVTILFSDLEDSSSLYEKFGDLRAHEIVRAHNEMFRRQVAAFRGHEVKALGDGFMVAFSSARRAAHCAIAVQRAFASYSRSHPEMPLRVRMGLHVGEAINESSDLFGKAVILASRIAGLAAGGQILVSSMLHDLAANAGDLRFNPLGERQLKGFGGAHSVYELIWQN
ncbi:MAG TPA: adenylate/guanylate cyclase domain-containing protein, partial [Roseiarcus sp.]|nr:adenylate/guanylate cyclase domain-containing protein [Roseiarcus sp.]